MLLLKARKKIQTVSKSGVKDTRESCFDILDVYILGSVQAVHYIFITTYVYFIYVYCLCAYIMAILHRC